MHILDNAIILILPEFLALLEFTFLPRRWKVYNEHETRAVISCAITHPSHSHTNLHLFYIYRRRKTNDFSPLPDSIRGPLFTVNIELPSHYAVLAIHLSIMKKCRRTALSHCGRRLALYLLNFLCSL